MAWNGSLWVAGGGRIAYSTNGINWTVSADPTIVEECHHITWNGTLWVAVGENINKTSAYSYNGDDWLESPDTNVFVGGSGYGWAVATDYYLVSTQTYFSITWNGSIWIAGGTDTIVYSRDGINWLPTNEISNFTTCSAVTARRILPNVGLNVVVRGENALTF